MNPSEEAKKANLDVRRETPPLQAEYMNAKQAEQGGSNTLNQREQKVLPNEQFPGQFEQGTAAAEEVDAPSNAGNAMPERDSLPQKGQGAPQPLNDPNPKPKDQGQPDGAAKLQSDAEKKEAEKKLESARNQPSGGSAQANNTSNTGNKK